MPNLFGPGALLGAIAPDVTPVVNPMAMLMAGIAQNNPVGAMSNMAGIQQRGQQLYLDQLAFLQQQEQAEQMARAQQEAAAIAQQQWAAEQALKAEQLAETQRHHMAQEGRLPGAAQLAQYYQGASPEMQELLQSMPAFGGGPPGTVVNVGGEPMSAAEAQRAAGVESAVSRLDRLESLLQGTAPGQENVPELSGLRGKWSEFMTGSGFGSGLVREIFGNVDPETTEAVQLAKQVQLEAQEALVSGVLSDQDRAQVQAALGLIGGPDTLDAVRRLRDVLSKKEYRTQELRGQAVPPEGDEVVAGRPPSGWRIISIEDVD